MVNFLVGLAHNPLVYIELVLVLFAAFFAFQKIREIRTSLDPEQFHVIIREKDQSLTGYFTKRIIEGRNTFFDVDEGDATKRYRFPKDQRKIYRGGTFRVPTVYYERGIYSDALALDHTGIALDREADRDYKASMTNKSINILIDAFRQQGFIDPQTSFIILLVAIIGTGGGVYYLLNQKIQLIISALGG